MSAHTGNEPSASVPLSAAAARFGISQQTLRRLCDSNQLACERDQRGWRVHPKEVENYLLARRPPGRQGIGLWLQGPAPNPRLRDGVGWRFMALGRGGRQLPVEIWFSSELVEVLRADDYDVREVVVGGSERLVEDSLLDVGELVSGQEFLYGSADRAFVLKAAGYADATFLPSDAPLEEGVSVVYDLSAQDFARDGLWPGDAIDMEGGEFKDVVVDTQPRGSFRRVRTVRLVAESLSDSRRVLIQEALRAYDKRCRELGLAASGWAAQVAARTHVLTLGQQRVLELTHGVWAAKGEWPTFEWVESQMDNQYDTNLRDVLNEVPPGLIWGLRPHIPYMERIVLTVAGLSHCVSAVADLAIFMAVLAYLVERRRTFAPASPTQIENLIVSSQEVREAVGTATAAPAGMVERLYDLLQQDHYLSLGGGRQADGTWNLVVGPESRRYRGVTAVEVYLSRLQPDATPWDDPVVANPPRLAPIPASIVQSPAPIPADSNGMLTEGVPPEADVFVLMPFAPQFDKVWSAIRSVAEQLDVTCIRADTITLPGRITQQIVEAIRTATAIVADVTDNNPNVMFELGYADALGKPIVVLNQAVAEAPFDLKDWRQIQYSAAELDGMRDILRQFLDLVLLRPRERLGKGVGPSAISMPTERPLVEVRGFSVPGDTTQSGDVHVKNVGTRPAIDCRPIVRGNGGWFVGGPTSVSPGEDMHLAAPGLRFDVPLELAPVGGQTVLYSDLEGWLYRTTQGGLTESWTSGQPKPFWVEFYETLSAAKS